MEKEKLTALVEKAKSSDRKAIEDLLCQAHTSVSYQCRKMLSNVQDAEDLTQEILLTVYQKLDTLQEPAAFWGWLSRITATRCMNALSRTHADLQFAEDEDGSSVLDSLETLDEHQIPDKAIDNAETARMIDEIVSGLPEAQRMSTLLYYYDEMSVKEIAQIMGVQENTVKGRLNLARKAIKEKVQDYEKKGVKLYSVSVLPLLWYFLRSAAQSEADAAAATACAANIMAAGAAKSAVGTTTAAETAATRVAGFFSKKVIAGILAGAVVVGGAAVAAIQLVNEFSNTVPAVICQHEWTDANCVGPKTCHKCGSTEGTALSHEWADADCENPKTCTVCGETDGDPLGHKWADATCETAKTCSVCNATEGEIPGHNWIEANYQAPQTCSVCGKAEGEVVTPDFVTYGFKVIPVEIGVEYDYVTSCYEENNDKKTTGKLWFSDYSIFESDETREAAEGYVWHKVTAQIRFDDNNAWKYGFYVRTCRENYYNIIEWDNSGRQVTEQSKSYTVNYNGIDYTECIAGNNTATLTGWVDRTNTYRCEFYWRVPVGYDGYILGFRDPAVEWGEGQYIFDIADENTLFFRFTDDIEYTDTPDDVPAETDPVETQPVVTEPVVTEPVVTEPVETEPAANVNYVPEGCTYTTADGTELQAGEAMPTVCSVGDKFTTESYIYMYGMEYGEGQFFDDDGKLLGIGFGFLETGIEGWGVTVKDQSLTSYSALQAEINGTPLVSLQNTFRMCKNMTEAPAIPCSVINMQETFLCCYSLTTAPVIPESVTNMSYTFAGCRSLTGTVEINANLSAGYSVCFSGTRDPITLTGSCPQLAELAATSESGNITVD